MADVYDEVFDAVREYEDEADAGAPVSLVITALCEDGSRPESLVRMALTRLVDRGTLYRPTESDHYRTEADG